MTQSPLMQPPKGSTRAEKLRAIAAVFGEEVAARLGPVSGLAPATQTDAADPDRLAWQTNRLIRHLRDRAETPRPAPQPEAQPTPPGRDSPPARLRRRAIPALAEGEDLSLEHPAVITRLLRAEPHEIRVAVLRALPGQIARDVMRRLKSG